MNGGGGGRPEPPSLKDLTLQKVQKENNTVFMMGDFNINLLKHQSHPETNDFISLMVSHYLTSPYLASNKGYRPFYYNNRLYIF